MHRVRVRVCEFVAVGGWVRICGRYALVGWRWSNGGGRMKAEYSLSVYPFADWCPRRYIMCQGASTGCIYMSTYLDVLQIDACR
jgi:hypothetical protein